MTEALGTRIPGQSEHAPGLVFEKIAIYRARSFRSSRFEINGLCAGINIIYGPNAAGKTTLAQAIMTLLWPQDPTLGRAEVAGQFRLAGADWRVDFDAGRVRYQLNGRDRGHGPGLAPQESRDRYYLGLRDLLDGKDEGFAAFIARESAGGYDVAAAASALGYSYSKRANNRKVEKVRARLGEAQDAQDELRREAGRLSELRRRLAVADAAQQRIALLRVAVEFGEAEALSVAARERLLVFPEAMAQVRGDEAERLDALRARVREADAAEVSTMRRYDALSERVAKSPLSRPTLEAADVEAKILDSVVPTLDGYLREIERVASERAAAQAEVIEAQAKADEAWRLISATVEPSSLDTISAEDLRAFSDLARRFDRVAGEVWAYKKLRGILTGANGADAARLESLRDAARQLRGWLRGRGDGSQGPATQDARKWAQVGRIVSLIATILAAIACIIWAYGGHSAWPVLLVAALIFGWLFGAASRVLSSLRAQDRGALEQRRQRETHRRAFERSGLAAPEAWGPDAVEQRLDEIEQLIASATNDVEKASRWSQEMEAFQATEQKQRALHQERDALAARVGLNLDLHFGGQYILGFGDEAAELAWLISHIEAWQRARMQASASAAVFGQKSASFEQNLEDFHAAIRPYLPAEVADAPDLASAQAQTRALEKGARALGQDLRERKNMQDALIEQRERRSQALDESKVLLARLQLIAESGAAPDINDADMGRAIDALCAQRADYEAAREESLAAHARLRNVRTRLEAQPGYAPDLLEGGPGRLAQEIVELSGPAAQRDAVMSQIARIEARVEDAKKSTALEQRRADYHAALDALAEDLAANSRSVAGAVLSDFLQRETRDSTRPAVFRRARELFARITHGRYRLDLDEGEGAQFRAFDMLNEVGQSLDELSSGTRVQLLLAVRVAFVEQLEQGAKLPLILDETLANSDDARARAIIDAVVQIAAEGRQIFYLTAQQDEVEKWRQVGAARAVACEFIDLGAITGAPDFRAEHPCGPETALNTPVFEKIEVPSAEGLTHAQYKDALDIRGALNPMTPIGHIHLWFLTSDPRELEQMLRADIARWGALKNLQRSGALEAVGVSAASYARIEARAKALGAYFDAWSVGRGKRVTRADLEDSGAVSDNFIDAVAELNENYGGDATKLLEGLIAGEIKRFQSAKRLELAEYFEAQGILDAREPLSEAERWTRVLAAVAPEIAAGVLDAGSIRETLARAL